MAIDSAEKRRSAAGFGFFLLGPGVTPNTDKDAEWRAQAGWGYSGISTIVAEGDPWGINGGARLDALPGIGGAVSSPSALPAGRASVDAIPPIGSGRRVIA